jgi:hypothetical protein
MSQPYHAGLSWFFFYAGVCRFALARYLYCAPPRNCDLEAAHTDIEIADGAPGQKPDVVPGLDHSGQPIPVMGLAQC